MMLGNKINNKGMLTVGHIHLTPFYGKKLNAGECRSKPHSNADISQFSSILCHFKTKPLTLSPKFDGE